MDRNTCKHAGSVRWVLAACACRFGGCGAGADLLHGVVLFGMLSGVC